MKLQIVSDLHLEFAPIELNNAGADVLILSGDILVADYLKRPETSPHYPRAQEWIKWFEGLGEKFPHIIYVLGNHEHYHGRFYETTDILRQYLGHIKNLHILDQDCVDLDGIRFIGGTLWTDFDHDNLKAMIIKDALNDYNCVQGRNYKKLQTGETAYYHANFLNLITQQAQVHDKIVIVGHHAPSYNSVGEGFRWGQRAQYNPGYASHLDDFVRRHPQIVLWTHGHMHDSSDYVIGKTRIVANPRGYQKSTKPENTYFDPNFIVEI